MSLRAAPEDPGLSVIITRGAMALFVNSLRNRRWAALRSRRAVGPDIKANALLVPGPPQPMLLAGDGDHHLIERPPITRARRMSADATGELPPDLFGPAPHCFMPDRAPAGGEHLLHHAEAQGKAEIAPDREADHLGRETVAGIQ